MVEILEKREWARNLKVGDLVCDCRYKHLQIAKLNQEHCVRYPKWLRNLLFADWMPGRLSDPLDDAYCWVSRKIGNEEYVDSDLILEDGSGCSAMSCCSPYNHAWEDPE